MNREGVYLCLRDDHYLGIGEIAPLPNFSDDSLENAKASLESLKPYLNEFKTPDSIKDIETIFEIIPPLSPSVQFGLEMALLTLLSEKKKLPVANLISSDCTYDVCINSLITSDSIHHIHHALKNQFSCFKLKVGRQSFEDDLHLTEKVLSMLKPEHKLKIDCNGLWSLDQALSFSKRFDHNRILYIEDPFESVDDQKAFVSQSNIPLALDEYQGSYDYFEHTHISYLVVKPMIKGSLLSLSKLPETIKKKIIISSSFETEVGLLGLLHGASIFDQSSYHGLDTLHHFQESNMSHDIKGVTNILSLPTFRSLIKDEWIPS